MSKKKKVNRPTELEGITDAIKMLEEKQNKNSLVENGLIKKLKSIQEELIKKEKK